MADEKKTSDTLRLRATGAWIAKELAKNTVALFFGAYVSLAVIIALLSWIFAWVAVHWLLLGCVLTAIATGAVIIWQAVEIRKLRKRLAPRARQEFQTIRVEDPWAKLHWILRRSPEVWKQYNEASELSPAEVQGILDGPFCSMDKCAARLEDLKSRRGSPLFLSTCPTCRKGAVDITPQGTGYGTTTSDLEIWPMRGQALSELQRMMRAGAKLEGPNLELGQMPQYWKRLRQRHR